MNRPISNGREPIKNVFVIDQAYYDISKKKTYSQWTIIDTRSRKSKKHGGCLKAVHLTPKKHGIRQLSQKNKIYRVPKIPNRHLI